MFQALVFLVSYVFFPVPLKRRQKSPCLGKEFHLSSLTGHFGHFISSHRPYDQSAGRAASETLEEGLKEWIGVFFAVISLLRLSDLPKVTLAVAQPRACYLASSPPAAEWEAVSQGSDVFWALMLLAPG
jgi:hypothetical protein